jgi:mono/diheme cytochrome c family protein
MRPRRTWSVLFLTLLLASLVAGCGEDAAPQPSQPPPATQVADAPAPTSAPSEASATAAETLPTEEPAAEIDVEAIYLRLCKSCHGAQREGFAKFPAIQPEDIADMSDEELLTLLQKGRMLTNMRSFRYDMTPEEMQALVAWLRSPVE